MFMGCNKCKRPSPTILCYGCQILTTKVLNKSMVPVAERKPVFEVGPVAKAASAVRGR